MQNCGGDTVTGLDEPRRSRRYSSSPVISDQYRQLNGGNRRLSLRAQSARSSLSPVLRNPPLTGRWFLKLGAWRPVDIGRNAETTSPAEAGLCWRGTG